MKCLIMQVKSGFTRFAFDYDHNFAEFIKFYYQKGTVDSFIEFYLVL